MFPDVMYEWNSTLVFNSMATRTMAQIVLNSPDRFEVQTKKCVFIE